MSVNPIPENYPRVCPFLTVNDVQQVIDFVQEAFGGIESEKIVLPDGTIRHAEVKIGDAVIMIGKARESSQTSPSLLYIYTEDTDATFERAIKAGGTSIMDAEDQYYGDRNAGVQGPQGNYWWIASRIEDLDSAEINRRAAAHEMKTRTS